MFVIVIYAIVGLELFKGQLHATCYKNGTQKYENVSYKYGPDAPLLLVDPGDISFDDDGTPYPCDDRKGWAFCDFWNKLDFEIKSKILRILMEHVQQVCSS